MRKSIDSRRSSEDLTRSGSNSNSSSEDLSGSPFVSKRSPSRTISKCSSIDSSKLGINLQKEASKIDIRKISTKDWTIVQKIVDRLCEYGMLAAYNSSTIEEYKSMLHFIESVETKYHDNMYIALCPVVKMLVMFRINKSVYVPSIMQTLNKTKINGTWLVL